MAVLRIDTKDERFQRAQLLTEQARRLDDLGHREEADSLSVEAHALLRELVREGWIGEMQAGRHGRDVPPLVTPEELATRLEASGGNAAQVARELGVNPRRVQALRKRIEREAASG